MVLPVLIKFNVIVGYRHLIQCISSVGVEWGAKSSRLGEENAAGLHWFCGGMRCKFPQSWNRSMQLDIGRTMMTAARDHLPLRHPLLNVADKFWSERATMVLWWHSDYCVLECSMAQFVIHSHRDATAILLEWDLFIHLFKWNEV